MLFKLNIILITSLYFADVLLTGPSLDQSLQHLGSAHGGELVNPGVNEETLEARHSHLHHLFQVRGVAFKENIIFSD